MTPWFVSSAEVAKHVYTCGLDTPPPHQSHERTSVPGEPPNHADVLHLWLSVPRWPLKRPSEGAVPFQPAV